MKVIGLIAEYNPFHLGHLYQIKKIKEIFPNSLIIAIISTNFTQRGDISIINKWEKTEISLNYGIDLVLELPTLYATQSADIFAYGAINILSKFKIDTLVFGSECGDTEKLKKLAEIQLNNSRYQPLVKKYLDTGLNYPTAMNKALTELGGINIESPNDLLGLSYIKEIIKNNYKITPLAIKRTNDYHENKINSSIVSANLIRKMYSSNEDVSNYIPSGTKKYLTKRITSNNAYPLLKYNIFINKNNLTSILDVEEGLENKIIKSIQEANNYSELVNYIKSKRYTYNRISRMLLHILLNIKKEDNTKETYLRVLGFTKNGQTYLNKIKKDITAPIYTNYKPGKNKVLDIEFTTTCIYATITDNQDLIWFEYRNKPIIK